MTFKLFLFFIITSCQIKHFDIGFGNSQMFINETDRNELVNKSKTILPTSSSLVYLQPFINNYLSFPLFINIPTSSQRFIIDNKEHVESAANVFGFGIASNYALASLSESTVIEAEIIFLVGSTESLDKKASLFPILAHNLRIVRDNGTFLFFGVEKTIGINVKALFYGLGQRF